MKNFLQIFLFVHTCLIIHSVALAQNYDCNLKKHWFFGRELNGSGNPTGNVLHLEFQCPNGNLVSASPHAAGVTPFGNEGSAVVNNFATGNWEMYSDGEHVIFPAAPPVSGFGGNPSSATTVLICPINLCPVDSFYFFSNPTSGTNAGIIQWNEGNLNGNFTPQQNLPMPPGSAVGNASNLVHGEGMWLIPVKIEPGNFWLVTRLLKDGGNSSTDAVVVYKITPSSIVIHQVFNLNTDANGNITNSVLGEAFTNFTFSPVRQEIAIADINDNMSVFTIPFNNSTGLFSGTVSNVISLGSLGAYDVEYSPSSNYLYYSVYNGGDLYAYNLTSGNSTLVVDNTLPNIKRGIGIQTGPDGNIYYVATSTPNWSNWNSELWQVTNPDNPAFVPTSYQYFGSWLLGNLPTFVIPPEFDLYANSSNNFICPNDSVQIGLSADLSNLSINNIYWYQDSTLIPGQNDSTIYVYQEGSYYVEIDLLNGCSYLSDTITIFPSVDLDLTITDFQCTTTDAIVDLEICNNTDTLIQSNVDITFYDDDPFTTAATEVHTQNFLVNLMPFGCQSVQFTIPNFSGSLYAVLNDPGGQATPYNLSNFPLNPMIECDYANNIHDTLVSCCFGDLSLIDTTFCSGDPNMTINATPVTGGTINWYSDPAYTNLIGTGASFTAIDIVGTTTYYVSENGPLCALQDSVAVTVNPLPTLFAGNDTTICEQSSIILTADNPDNATLNWNNGVLDGVAFTPGSTSDYIVSGELQGCMNEDTITVSVNPYPTISTNPDTDICDGDSVLVTLNNPDGATISWNPVLTAGTYINPPIGQNQYNLTADLSGCILNDSFTITVYQYPQISINVPSDTSFCEGTSLLLNASVTPNASFTWNNGVQNNVPFTPATGFETYVVTTDNNGCQSFDSVLVTVHPNPEFDYIVSPPDYCYQLGGSVEFTPLIQGLEPYVVNGPYGSSNNLLIDSLSDGSYLITITDNNGCNYVQNITISSSQIPYEGAFTYYPSAIYTWDTQVNFINQTTGGYDYQWVISGDGYQYTYQTEDLNYEFPQVAGEYEVCLIANFGGICVDTTCQTVVILEELLLYVPNAFTPEGDLLNNTFTPVFSNNEIVENYHLTVYNRWGEVLFESYSQYVGWDGTYGGKIVQDGVYVWEIEYDHVDLISPKKVRGHITVLK